MTESEQREAVKLVRILCSYSCTAEMADGDGELCDSDDRGARCGPCHAHAFLNTLDSTDTGESDR